MIDQIFDEEYDVVVIGYGYAGAVVAIDAHDAGAKVLLVEKMDRGGGISILSGGALRIAENADEAFKYLQRTNAGTTPDPVIRALAEGMTTIAHYVKQLADAAGAVVSGSGVPSEGPDSSRKGGNYPFEGYKTFYNVRIEAGHENMTEKYPLLRCSASAGGPYLFSVMEKNIELRNIEVRYETSALRLISDEAEGVTGVIVETAGKKSRIKARRGVVLACGGFEANEDMKRQYFPAYPLASAASRGNTGDGIRMAQDVGAALWHMWHFHGSYAFHHIDPAYPYALRCKRLPDWNPADKTSMKVPMVWILVDSTGRRFMNECPPYTQDTGHRSMEVFDTEKQVFPRSPSFLVCDEDGRKTYRLGDPRSNDPLYNYDWSTDNLKEIGNGILKQFDTLDEVALDIGADPETFKETVRKWNEACATETDNEFGRPPGTMRPIAKAPFIVGRVYPVINNTQGGPVHDADQHIMNPYNEPIKRLYAAGELGSSFGNLYLSGGNIAECYITGRIAAKNVAAEPAWDSAKEVAGVR